MSTKAKSSSKVSPEPDVIPLPPWFKGFALSASVLVPLLVAIVAWEANRTISKVDALTNKVSVIDSRLTGIETKLEILTPLPEQISKLTSEIAELRGQLSGRGPAAKSAPSSAASVSE